MFILENKNLIILRPSSARQVFGSFSNGINFFNEEALSAGRRKAILKAGILLLALSCIGYVVFTGTIVSNNVKRTELLKKYEAESRALEIVRSELIEGNAVITIDYLNSLGYRETKNLNVIKRTNNVAGKEFNSYQ